MMRLSCLFVGLLVGSTMLASAQVPTKEKPTSDPPKKETPTNEQPKKETPTKDPPKKETPNKEEPKKETPKPYAITITGEVDVELAVTAGKLTTVFYECYPKLVARFDNPKRPAPRQIRVVFDKNMRVPAYCTGKEIHVSVEWLKKNPNDIGMLTHELTHSVQGYRGAPGWMTEGIADYARLVFGPKEQPGWSLPTRLTAKQSYKDSYRTSARFFQWLDEKYPGTVDKLHRKLQDRDFNIDDFKTLTGKTVDELWETCVKDLAEKKK